MRSRLVAGAVRLVDKHGADGLQVRKLAAAVGTSTMAVYTHFSGMSGIIDAVRAEGYRRLSADTYAVPVTDDPVTDFAALGLAYRQTAVDSPHLFAMLFQVGAPELAPPAADSAIVGEEPEWTEDGRHAFDVVIGTVQRAMDAGRFRVGDPVAVARQWWAAQHGVVVLEQGGRFAVTAEYAVDAVLLPLILNLIIGFGDEPEKARISVDHAVAEWRARRA
jgi:AcrR family transcriptional regulator